LVSNCGTGGRTAFYLFIGSRRSVLIVCWNGQIGRVGDIKNGWYYLISPKSKLFSEANDGVFASIVTGHWSVNERIFERNIVQLAELPEAT
jgi:hypothetical protein